MKKMENNTSVRTVIMAREVGFCFGVKRAINLTRQALAERSDVFILGDLVHNKRVTHELENKGLHKVDGYQDRQGSTMVIRAHGLPKARIQEARDRNVEIVDATCPIVLRAQEAAQALERRGFQVVIVGDKDHAEIKGIVGNLDHPALVIGSLEELGQARESHTLLRKVGVIFQTTLALELCREIVDELVTLCKEIDIINTICRPVRKRQEDAAALAQRVDLMLVIGSHTSANTMELAALCRLHNANTLQIQSADELSVEDFDWANQIGIASGLSTPEELVECVRAKIVHYNQREGEPPTTDFGRPDANVFFSEESRR